MDDGIIKGKYTFFNETLQLFSDKILSLQAK